MGEPLTIMIRSASRTGTILALVLVGLAWFAVIRIVQSDWRIDPQYSYGIIVPVLALGLVMKRREDCPPPAQLTGKARRMTSIVLLSASILLSAVIPLAEANPDWRPLGGVAALATVAITLCLITCRGGIPWLGHYAFAVGFFLISIPWPRNFEQTVMSSLMSWNASTTVEILHWCGYEAVRQGNLIMIPAGILGIEEACSGIRSLQSGLMVALFFGEIFRLTMVRRLFLVLLALVAAMAGNLIRSSFLSILASRQGMSAVPEWHDQAGIIILIFTFLIVFGSSLLWRSSHRGGKPKQDSRDPSASVKDEKVDPPRMILVSAITMLLMSMVLTEIWFRIHDLPSGSIWGWTIEQRSRVPGVVPVPVAPATLRMLFHPEGFSERWIGSGGEMGQVFMFQWPPGRTALQSVQMHNPEVCLSSMGMRLEKRLCDYDIGNTAKGLRLHSWLFSQQGKPVYVFHSIFEQNAGPAGESRAEDQPPLSRLENLKSGKRNRAQRMVEVAFWNLHDETEAREALSRYLAQSMTMTPAPFTESQQKPRTP